MKPYLILPLFLLLHFSLHAQVKCCDDVACRQRAISLAASMNYYSKKVGPCQRQDSANQRILDKLKADDPNLYTAFTVTARQAATFIEDSLTSTCFSDALDDAEANNVFKWLLYINRERINNPQFPSSEFCGGFGRRFELSQGAANIFSNEVAYLGIVRGYITYTFAPGNTCGGHFRILMGPAFILRNNTIYSTLSTRVAYRIKDITPRKLPVGVGNLSVFAEYNTSFVHYNQVAIGAELQLGPFGINVAVNNELKSAKPGFAVGVVLFHQSFKKAK
ncbi:MAG TPA: hypothetical protein VM802_26570 [Chitinophaga sp.]|uniref:hypothetical protein n=1 Tax=Chitinophaga sp. TaxID=1869181 RepID=UPI002C1AAC6F|nr:hypothetical protein [Chitinophaga sp.]HVI48462.1 hypothetical protein [Chitinophaga sp.]